jgi:hypothetical protein
MLDISPHAPVVAAGAAVVTPIAIALAIAAIAPILFPRRFT